MDALLAKIEGAATGVKLMVTLAEAQDQLVSPETGLALARRAGSKMELIAGVTAWRDAHDEPEWTQVNAMLFGEVLKAFDAAALVVAAEAAAAEAVAAEAAAAEKAATMAAEAAAAPIMAAQLVDATARIEALVQTNTEQTDRIVELEARMKEQETKQKEEVNELKEQNGRLTEQLREQAKSHEAGMEAARQGLRQQEAARQAVVRRRESEEADAAAAAAPQQAEKDERAGAKAAVVNFFAPQKFFEASAVFQGPKHGAVFKMGPSGLGYYHDRPHQAGGDAGAKAAVVNFFEASAVFKGPVQGAVFKMGPSGLGYYQDTQ